MCVAALTLFQPLRLEQTKTMRAAGKKIGREFDRLSVSTL
jgi:hypothetical protein